MASKGQVKGKQRDYAKFLYNIAFGGVECIYDIGVVWPFEDGGIFVVQSVAYDSSDCVVMGYCVF